MQNVLYCRGYIFLFPLLIVNCKTAIALLSKHTIISLLFWCSACVPDSYYARLLGHMTAFGSIGEWRNLITG